MKGPTSSSKREPESAVGFFSFTRTGEGSSLTTDASLLAMLFPPHERHMVISSGELDAVDDPIAAENDSDDDGEKSGLVKCLQIDLRRFGLGELCFLSRSFAILTIDLDKHGLVNRFSRVLEEENINHMYSSTFKTANLLVCHDSSCSDQLNVDMIHAQVDKAHANRAQALLRSC